MKKTLLFMSMLLSYMVAKADLLYVEPFVAEKGVTNEDYDHFFSICLENDNAYTAFQFDLYLPDGMSILDDDGYQIDGNFDRVPFTKLGKNKFLKEH